MTYNWKISGYVVLLIILSFAALFLLNSSAAAVLLGSTSAIVTSPRFIVAILIGLVLLKFLNPILSGVLIGLTIEAILHLTLSEFWDEIGIQRSFFSGALRSILAATLVLSLLHFLVGLARRRTIGETK